MNEKPLVSVIIPTYKRPINLKEAINTIQKQTYKNLEIIIVDDNDPNDEYRQKTKEVISGCSNEKIIYIEHDRNKGACAARNTGIKKSNGEYVAFLDDDDQWAETKLEKQVDLITKNKEVGLVFCNFKYKNGLRETNFEFNTKNMFVELLKRGSGISTSTFLVKKNIFKKINGFDIKLPSNQDYDLLLRISQFAKIDYSPEVLMFYDNETAGITHNYKYKLKGRERIIEKYKIYYYEFEIEEFLSKQYDKAAYLSIMANNRAKAIKYLDDSLNHKSIFKNKIKRWIIFLGGKQLYLFFLKFNLKISTLSNLNHRSN